MNVGLPTYIPRTCFNAQFRTPLRSELSTSERIYEFYGEETRLLSQV
jgi:hypothetical protein